MRKMTVVSILLGLVAAGVPPVTAQNRPLPETVEETLQAYFYLDPARELFGSHSTLDSARQYVETTLGDVRFNGEQIQENEISVGYVSPVPENIVSITLFFDRDTESLRTLHVLISPGMSAFALRFIETAWNSSQSGDTRTYLLGTEVVANATIVITLQKRASDLGDLYSINYIRADAIPER
jgi:hypothetical protein